MRPPPDFSTKVSPSPMTGLDMPDPAAMSGLSKTLPSPGASPHPMQGTRTLPGPGSGAQAPTAISTMAGAQIPTQAASMAGAATPTQVGVPPLRPMGVRGMGAVPQAPMSTRPGMPAPSGGIMGKLGGLGGMIKGGAMGAGLAGANSLGGAMSAPMNNTPLGQAHRMGPADMIQGIGGQMLQGGAQGASAGMDPGGIMAMLGKGAAGIGSLIGQAADKFGPQDPQVVRGGRPPPPAPMGRPPIQATPATPSPMPDGGAVSTAHLVQKGDTLGGLLQKYQPGLSGQDLLRAIQQVAAANGIQNPDLIRPGQEIELGARAPGGPMPKRPGKPQTPLDRALATSPDLRRLLSPG